MNIKLAGFNIDSELIKEINSQIATPETISAAYARISRSQKDVTALRQESLNEVEKARLSNSNIIYEMGHSSIAEHAVFNFDLIGISRLMSELIQRSRLASFTEKSQRYVTLKGDYIVPEEIKKLPDLEKKFHSLIEKQNHLYEFLFEEAKLYLQQQHIFDNKRDLEGKAKEDARYVLSLATQTQMGITINGRSLERLLRRLDSSDLIEAKTLKQTIEEQVKPIAPSLIKYTDADHYGKNISLNDIEPQKQQIHARMIEMTDNAERKILIAHFMDQMNYSYNQAESIVKKMSSDDIKNAFLCIYDGIKSYHTLPRSFEMCDITLELSMSSSCFGQLKRHRMASIFRSAYHPAYDYSVPPLLQKLNVEDRISILMKESETLYYQFEKVKQGLGAYCLTNAHHVNVLMKCNLRELYHFIRLRSDQHAQWEIKQLSDEILALVKPLLPNAALYLAGKDSFHLIHHN
ncbi:MAG: FAD-dependent thymidylate synthase [Candidatus Cloacimonetes bacterium]|nr:FAD-dependent thymidylate synthase [Candidatus Cloacimonadota bacterium]